ncbi:MAG: pgk [Rickettsiaceae bacterium]|jgi:phosphoglycerate kinase|nr:pgk [Rickettsiaceae bacterium]
MTLRTLKDIDVKGKVVLCRVDFNVPMKNGRVEDATRVIRITPTIRHLIDKKAKVVVISHFGRPKGEFVREMSLAPLADALSLALDGTEVKFALDCIGKPASDAIGNMNNGDVLLLENLRFHSGEEKNDPAFIQALAELGDIYVNDTFSCSHRAHASIVGIAEKLPSVAGLLLQEEIENLERVLKHPEGPFAAIVGGSKVSTKLGLLHSMVNKVDMLVIGGAMANTFLKASGNKIGKSLYENDLVDEAKSIMEKAKKAGCEIFLPSDVVIAKELAERTECKVVSTDNIPADYMILDLGPASIAALAQKLNNHKTIVWNGPLGAFEYRPFDVGTISLAQSIAFLTSSGQITSVAGGGDVVAALGVSGLTNSFSYISTAGGAFLDWLQGNGLPGVRVLSR